MSKVLSLIIPVFNEEKTIEKLLKKVAAANLGYWQKELIIVDDHSKDSSVAIIKKMLPYLKKHAKKVNLILSSKNGGKGAAVCKGLKVVSGNVVVFQDADLEYNPNDLKKLLELSNDNTLVFGYRKIDFKREGFSLYAVGIKASTILLNLLYLVHLTDLYTCYKLFPLKQLRQINYQGNGFEIDIDIVCKLLKKGIQVKEALINYYPRSFEEGKKIRLKDGLLGLWIIIKNRFIL